MKKLILLAILSCAACFPRRYDVTALPGEPGHYVLVQTKRGTDKVYDCKTAPDGQNWAPECKEVKR
jgi:hypothetical protein